MDHHDLLSGFVRVHVLHHAVEGEIYGHWMIEELARHGYKLSPGTLYPMLHAMEEKGYLVSREDQGGPGGRRRRLYSAAGSRSPRRRARTLARARRRSRPGRA